MRLGKSLVALLAASVALIPVACRPGLGSSGGSADQTAAIAQLRSIRAAQASYQATHYHYACTMSELGTQAGLIDKELSFGEKGGYAFSIQCKTKDRSEIFQAWAIPQHLGVTGRSYFCVDETGTIRSTFRRMDDCNDGTPVD